MLGRRFRIGEILGFEIAIDSSWIIIAALVTWTLAEGWFPSKVEGLDARTYWVMGAVGALGLFAAVVVHELSHSLVARRHGIEMRGITLFLFGGVANMGAEPSTPRAEFQIAVIGPITSVLIAGVFWGAEVLASAAGAPLTVTAVLSYLAVINLILAGFNLLPAFPLDGGRVLRAILWHTKGSLRRATDIASQVGGGFGLALIALGVLAFMAGNVIGGVWQALLGLFLRGAARMSYRDLLMRESLEGEPVSRFMRADPVTVAPGITLSELVEGYIYRDFHKLYPVVDGGRLQGCVTIRRMEMKIMPRQTRLRG